MSGVTLRSARWDDAAAVNDLFNRVANRVHGTADSTVDEVLRFWRSPRVDLDLDTVVAERPDGMLTGYADLFAEGDEHDRIWMDLRGEPADELLRELERRAHARAGGAPAFLRADVPAADEDVRSALERAGYRVVRYSSRMVGELDGELPAPEWPAGVTLVPFRQERDEQRVFEVQQETFGDMWEFQPQPIEEWREWMFGERHDPELWFLAEADGELAGVALCRTSDPGDPDMGWISVLGVRRPWRRRGLALALLRHTFREFRARGRRRVGLGVDAESETGAVQLYERAGMRATRRYETWEKDR